MKSCLYNVVSGISLINLQQRKLLVITRRFILYIGYLVSILILQLKLYNDNLDFSEKEKDHVAQEMSDILIYLVRLADRCRIDLPAAVLQKFQQNREKYPVHKAYGKNKKYTEYVSEDDGKGKANGDK